MAKRWYLYMLQCNDGSIYTGVTTDVGRRLQEHNNAKGSKYVGSRLPVKLMMWWKFIATRSEILKVEIKIKSIKRGGKIHLIMRPKTIEEIIKLNNFDVELIECKAPDEFS